MIGEAATTFALQGGAPLSGSGVGNKDFSRVGFEGLFYLGPKLTSRSSRSTVRIARGSAKGTEILSITRAACVRTSTPPALQQHRPGAAGGGAASDLERSVRRDALGVESAVDRIPALGVGSNVAAVHAWDAVGSGQPG